MSWTAANFLPTASLTGQRARAKADIKWPGFMSGRVSDTYETAALWPIIDLSLYLSRRQMVALGLRASVAPMPWGESSGHWPTYPIAATRPLFPASCSAHRSISLGPECLHQGQAHGTRALPHGAGIAFPRYAECVRIPLILEEIMSVSSMVCLLLCV